MTDMGEFFVSSSYLPSLDELMRANKRFIQHLLDTDDWLRDRPSKERECAFMNVYGLDRGRWAEFADPADLEKFRLTTKECLK